METATERLAKQFNNNDVIREETKRRSINCIGKMKKESFLLMHPYIKPNSDEKVSDEPIDLTRTREKFKRFQMKTDEISLPPPTFSSSVPSSFTIPPFYSKSKGRRSKVQEVIEFQATESKQTEILKDAKSLFSKRTRTLYHWMYPNAPKQQIKAAVANCWDKLGVQEKQFYISQVLVKFGFPQCNLMINPQLELLGGIKELAELPASSSSAEKGLPAAILTTVDSFGQNTKRRQGRPAGSKNRKINKFDLATYKIAKDFQDDPELSKELEKFAISFDYFK